MRKMLKKVMTVFTAGVLACSAAALAACGYSQDPLGGDYSKGSVVSNGGFVVEKGDYVYFINGVEAATADNTYGTPVKGALMRIAKSDVEAGKGDEVDTVVPSLMVSGDIEAGIFIYGDRVYYATPNSDKDISGNVANSYLDFKSARLDGTDVKDYFYVSNSDITYRYVQPEENGAVYLLYVDGSDLHSYNTADGTDTLLVKGAGSYQFYKGSEQDAKETPYVYYTMTVTANIDVVGAGGGQTRAYNQIYRVRADATKAPDGYDYNWDQAYLDANDGVEPYVNLGEIVLDGIGSNYEDNPTRFTHDLEEGIAWNKLSPMGYSYVLQSYTNGGIYFTRSNAEGQTSSPKEDDGLLYLDENKITSGWNSITANITEPETIAKDTTRASGSALYYDENGKQYYLFVEDSSIFRAEAGVLEPTRLAIGVGSASLSRIDEEHHFLYYTVSGSIYRIVYNGTEENYKNLNAEVEYQPTQILKISHATNGYPFELFDDTLYFWDSESLGGTYNYLSAVSLKNESGTAMTNTELADYNKKYEEAIGDDSYYKELQDEDRDDLADAVRYYFYVGNTDLFDANVKEAEEKTGKPDTLYSADDTADFRKFVAGELEGQEGKPLLRSDFITRIGKWTDNDSETLKEYFRTSVLKVYTEPTASEEEEEGGLPAWGWALIGIAIGLVVIGVGVLIYFMLRARKEKENEPAEEKEFVDTTDDRDIDVYAENNTEAPTEEPAEEPAEVPTEESVEEPAEEPAEESVEEPAEEPAEAPTETPAEAPTDEGGEEKPAE